MYKFLIVSTVWITSFASANAFAATIPCEDALKTLRDTATLVKPNVDLAAKIKVLEDKGVERCNADDDKRADGFFSDAMKLMGK